MQIMNNDMRKGESPYYYVHIYQGEGKQLYRNELCRSSAFNSSAAVFEDTCGS